MTIDQIRTDIKKRRENEETYESIAADLGISRAMVKYIETHPAGNAGAAGDAERDCEGQELRFLVGL